jgi:hypothetical protein
MEPQWEFWTKTIYDPAIFWAMVTALATVLLVAATLLLVWIGIIPLVRARRADLGERFRSELLRPSTQKIFFLAAHGLFRFQTDPTTRIGYFMIIQAQENIIDQRLRQLLGEQRIVLTFEMDDEFLSPLEEMARDEEKNVLDFEYVFRNFGDYVDVAMRNEEIRRYVMWLREKAQNPNLYVNLEKLHAKLDKRAGRAPKG